MQKRKKTMKSHAKQHSTKRPIGMKATRVVPASRVQRNEESKTFTPMETGQPDRELNEGGGPLNQEGEGNRQNDELAELESIEPGNEAK